MRTMRASMRATMRASMRASMRAWVGLLELLPVAVQRMLENCRFRGVEGILASQSSPPMKANGPPGKLEVRKKPCFLAAKQCVCDLLQLLVTCFGALQTMLSACIFSQFSALQPDPRGTAPTRGCKQGMQGGAHNCGGYAG